jgi:hypothetical protein
MKTLISLIFYAILVVEVNNACGSELFLLEGNYPS